MKSVSVIIAREGEGRAVQVWWIEFRRGYGSRAGVVRRDRNNRATRDNFANRMGELTLRTRSFRAGAVDCSMTSETGMLQCRPFPLVPQAVRAGRFTQVVNIQSRQ
jgi:hypothetical protein